MQHRKSLPSLLVAPLLAVAVAAPAALAQPIDPPTTSTHREAMAKQDQRTEATADTSRAPKSPAGLPTWPTQPRVITPPVAQQPVADGVGDGGDIEWPVAVLAMAGTLLLGGSLGVAGTRYRVSHTHVAG
jgi:hypothetical protein